MSDALVLARQKAVDLVEIAPNANPPVCRLIEYGKFKYELEKRQKESRKHQHANKVKEIQLSANIDPHDFGVKLAHAIEFLCDDLKVKASLRFRGREMAHKEFGFQVIEKFTKELNPFGSPDFPAKLVGRSINMMYTPLPKHKRARNPRQGEEPAAPDAEAEKPKRPATASATETSTKPGEAEGFANNPFGEISIP